MLRPPVTAVRPRRPARDASPYSCPVVEEDAANADAANSEPASATTPAKPEDNSLGRLLTLSDGVFAIAMTLLALDLKVPDLAGHVTDAQLRHALAQNTESYWSYLLTFYVIATYWGAHRRLMRSVVASHPNLIRDTIFLLVIVAAMPFPASLLGRYGGTPTALALYGAANALATLAIMLLGRDVRLYHLAGRVPEATADDLRKEQTWLNLAVFLLCIPAGYLLGEDGPFVLLLLAIPNRLVMLSKLARRYRLNALWARIKARSTTT
jgi:uncharacterized membrane protein